MPLCVCTRLPKYVTIKDVLILCIRRLRRRRKTGKEKKNMIVRAVSKEKNIMCKQLSCEEMNNQLKSISYN